MTLTPTKTPVARISEPFREKVIRKCHESVEVKEKFFSKYAEPLEGMAAHRATATRRLAVYGETS